MEDRNNIERRFFVRIRFHEDTKNITLSKVYYYRNDMDFQFFIRWKWYFEYRAALLRVQNPHGFIELSHGSYEYVLPEDTYKKKVHNLLIAAKRKRTEFRNQIQYARDNWNELFPIEDHPKWVKVEEKLAYYEKRVVSLSEEYNNINQKPL